VKFYKNRILNINQVHEKIEEQQQSLIKNLENKKFYLKEGFDNNSISNLPNSNSDMSSRFENDEDLIISRNSLRKRTLKISTQNHFGETIQDSNQALTRSSFSSEKNLSFRQDEIDTEKPFDRKFNALSSIKKESSLIPEIVKSKFQVLQKKGLNSFIFRDNQKNDLTSFSLDIRKPTQTTSFKKRYSTKISSQANNIKKKKSILPAFPSKGDYHENDSSKTTIKGFTLPLLDIKKINSNQELEGKVSPFISARSKGNCLTLDDSPRSKKITFLKYLEDNVKNPSLLHTDQSLQRISIQNKFENLSSKGFLSARDLHPLETSSPYFNSKEYIVTNSNTNMAHLELNSPFASKKNKLSLCINTLKTSDMISSTSRVFRKNEEIVSPDSNIKEIFKVPMSVRGPSNKNPLNSKTIFPSKHNMFRMKPDKLHIFNNYYKNNSYKK